METSPENWGFFVLFEKMRINMEVFYKAIIIEFWN